MNIKKFISIFWPVALIFALWIIFAKPYFIEGKVPYPSTYQVNHFHPWSSYEKFWGPVKNGAMPDVIDQIYPWKHFTIETWKKGQVPLWNPNSFSGNPHLANYQSAVFSPFNLIFYVLPFVDAWSIVILLQPLLAAFFTYLFMREIGVSKSGSLISSISFMFCGFIVAWMAYGTLSMAIAFLPLSLFAIERYFNTERTFYLFLLTLTVIFSFFSGHFQTSIYFFLTSFFYVIYKGFIRNVSFSLPLFFSLFLGLSFSLVQIIPSIQFYYDSVRSEIFNKGDGIPFYYLITSIAPDFFGNPVTRNDWFGYYAEWASFIGIVPFFLALYAFTKKQSQSLFFLFLALISLVFAVDSPIQDIFGVLKIPVLSTSNVTRIIVLFSFSVAVLAGIGMDKLRESIINKDSKRIIALFFLIVIILIAFWIFILEFKPFSAEQLIIAQRNFMLPVILFIGTTIVIFLARFKKELLLFSIFFLLFFTSFDSFRFAQKWMPFDPRELVFQDLPVIAAMQKNVENGRVFGNLGAQIASYYDIPVIEGYDPLYIKRYGEFIRFSSAGSFQQAERSVVKLDRLGKYTERTLDLLGVNVIFHPTADTYQSWAFPVWDKPDHYTPIYKDEKFILFKNNMALKRAVLFYDYEIIKDNDMILKRFYSDEFDFRKKLILEEKPPIVPGEGSGTVIISSYSPNEIIIHVTTDRPALLFLSDNYYPGWNAWINDKKENIYRADYAFRSVVVPAGKSKVKFAYENWFF